MPATSTAHADVRLLHVYVNVCVPADQLPAEQQQGAAAAQLRWLQQQPLLARLFTSRQQEDSILALTQQQAAAAAVADAPNGAEVDMQPADGGSSSAAAAADLLVLKRDMLRVEALVATALKVRLLLTSKYLRLHPALMSDCSRSKRSLLLCLLACIRAAAMY